jgi:predicted SAM-dependent methyltransferase
MVLNLGAGIAPLEGAINHDRTTHAPHIDMAHDLDRLPWPWADGAFSRIVAQDVVEHLRVDVAEWMGECWRILTPGGLLEVRVPAWDHENTWTDPTHRRAFAPRTFDYWDPDKPLHQKYGAFYFGETARWWAVEQAERVDGGCNLSFRLRKR